MNILKKGSAITASIICMVVIAGYINYEYNPEREKNLGKTIYVSAGQDEVIKVTNDEENVKQNSGNISDGYIFVNNVHSLDIQNIKENLTKLEDVLRNKQNGAFATYNESNNKYYIYIDNTITEEEVMSIVTSINLSKDDVVIRKNN